MTVAVRLEPHLDVRHWVGTSQLATTNLEDWSIK